jgi:hypothetical protein
LAHYHHFYLLFHFKKAPQSHSLLPKTLRSSRSMDLYPSILATATMVASARNVLTNLDFQLPVDERIMHPF